MAAKKKNQNDPVSAALDPRMKRLALGPFHLKDGKIEKIDNSAEPFMVIKEILFRKVPGQSNRVEVILVMPDPETIDVIEKNKN